MTKSKRKRFIAGAVCPQCNLADKIYLLGEDAESVRCCNHCGFEERLADVAAAPELASAVEVQPINLGPLKPSGASE